MTSVIQVYRLQLQSLLMFLKQLAWQELCMTLSLRPFAEPGLSMKTSKVEGWKNYACTIVFFFPLLNCKKYINNKIFRGKGEDTWLNNLMANDSSKFIFPTPTSPKPTSIFNGCVKHGWAQRFCPLSLFFLSKDPVPLIAQHKSSLQWFAKIQVGYLQGGFFFLVCVSVVLHMLDICGPKYDEYQQDESCRKIQNWINSW